MDVMLDLETLGTRPEAVVLTFGAIKFDPWAEEINGDKGMYLRIDVDEQSQLGREIQQETLDWWGKQDPAVFEEALGEDDRVSVTEFLDQLNRFLVGVDNIWAQGPAFDIVILENMYRQMGRPTPWQFWQIRDSRTLFAVHGDPREKGREAAHNALMDCFYQAQGVQTVYQRAKIEKRGYRSGS